MEQGFGFRFYNAGKRISELIKFSTTDSALGQAEHGDGISNWPLEAPEKSWFFVPNEVDCGTERIRVTFKDDIRSKFGARGVVLLDPRHDASTEDPERDITPVAATEEAVVERAEQLWHLYTLGVIERHLHDSDQALAAGGRPRKASGFTKFCFKLHDKIDPGDTYAHTENVSKGGVSGDVAAVLTAMQQQQANTTAILLAIASGQKLDPEMLKALMTPPTPAPVIETGKPVTSGIATGTISKPIGDKPDGWAKGVGNLDKGTLREKGAPKAKGARTEEAVSAL